MLGEAVAKPLAGSLGDGVERVRDDEEGRGSVRARVARDGAMYLQAFVPHPGRDLRVFVVGGRARAAIERHAPPGEWRTNVVRGGRTEPAAPGGATLAVAEAAARALGLDYAGVDLVPTGEGADRPRGEREPQLAGDPGGHRPRHGGGHRRARARSGPAPA